MTGISSIDACLSSSAIRAWLYPYGLLALVGPVAVYWLISTPTFNFPAGAAAPSAGLVVGSSAAANRAQEIATSTQTRIAVMPDRNVMVDPPRAVESSMEHRPALARTCDENGAAPSR